MDEEFKKIKKIILHCCPDIKEINLPLEYIDYFDKNGDYIDTDYDPTHFHEDMIKVREGYSYICYYDYGEIDHQSRGLLKNFLKKENISLGEFLIDRGYILILDRDDNDYEYLNQLFTSGKMKVSDIRGFWSSSTYSEE